MLLYRSQVCFAIEKERFMSVQILRSLEGGGVEVCFNKMTKPTVFTLIEALQAFLTHKQQYSFAQVAFAGDKLVVGRGAPLEVFVTAFAAYYASLFEVNTGIVDAARDAAPSGKVYMGKEFSFDGVTFGTRLPDALSIIKSYLRIVRRRALGCR
jgi:hypothetical protein